jgi:hypothetical protein
MRIDETRQYHAASHIELFRPPRFRPFFHLRARPRRHNPAVAHQQRAISNQAQLGKGTATPWNAAAQRQNLRSTCDE